MFLSIHAPLCDFYAKLVYYKSLKYDSNIRSLHKYPKNNNIVLNTK